MASMYKSSDAGNLDMPKKPWVKREENKYGWYGASTGLGPRVSNKLSVSPFRKEELKAKHRAGSQELRLRSGRGRRAGGPQGARTEAAHRQRKLPTRLRPLWSRVYTTYCALNPSQPSAMQIRTFDHRVLSTQRKRLRTPVPRLQRADAESNRDSTDNWQISGVNFIVSDSGAHVLNSWTQEDQNLQELMAALAAVGPPNPRADPECCSILHGLVAAVETLCKITEYQHEARTLLMENAERVGNRGRIICITNAKSFSLSLMQIQKCELVLIHTYPVGEDSLVSDRPKKELSPVLTSEVHSVRAGRHLATKLNILVQQHFDLASTTITNIPMKEEQHANTSANYDVELLHHKDAHVDFLKSGDTHLGGSSREGPFKETITLKWCTPRTNNIELHYCTGAYRISPVDVNSRPSSCLTNFLLNGRSVLLEQPRKSGSKVISHMLSSHGGEIFLHVLSSSRSILEDPPSISEGCGGRVTDYRITDFGEFMRENRLTPFLDPRYKIDGSLEIPLERAKDQLEKHTRYWPMIISQTTIFNMQAVVPLASVIVKESLTEEDVLNCQKTIYNLVDMERKNDPLPISTVGTRGKGPKRDEQYRIMWNELETLVRAHINNSEKHQRVLECLMACRSKPPEEEERKKRGRKREDKEDKSEKAVKDYEQEKPWQDSERLKGILERGKEELAEAEIIKDSPDSPEPPNKKPLVEMDETPQVEKSKGKL
uniref:integrator complex subunit 13 n=1 Tax=Ictidomys tridecemlineatus TaxID=43179 RepID=UPI001A9ECF47|nr:integrator complex subunit 13 [Ictidomys tridecemlineatus]